MKTAKKWHLWLLIRPDGGLGQVFTSRRYAQDFKRDLPDMKYRLAHLPIKPIKLK